MKKIFSHFLYLSFQLNLSLSVYLSARLLDI